MRLNKLELHNFRNYESLSLDFEPGVNLIVGNNAQGKTNLLEAICYAGSGKSFRALKTSEMIRFGAAVFRQPSPADLAQRCQEENFRGPRGGASHGAVLPGRSDGSENRCRAAAAVG